MGTDVAVIGAGPAGAGVVHALAASDVDADVTVYEKQASVSGRSATRRSHGCLYDVGANYVSPGGDRVNDLLRDYGTDLIDVEEPVWTFDADGAIEPGHGENDHKWSCRDGIDRFVGELLDATDAAVELETPVESLERGDERWRLDGANGSTLTHVDHLVVTPPAPLSADLLGRAEWSHRDCRQLRTALESVPYRTLLSAILHYPAPIDVPWYALINADDDHEIGWLSREECKPGHVPDDGCLLVVQLSPETSADEFRDDEDAVTSGAADRVADLLGEDRLADPDWTDLARFRYGLPDAAVDGEAIDRARTHDLWFAGDWVAGEGRVHRALETGLETGDYLVAAIRDG